MTGVWFVRFVPRIYLSRRVTDRFDVVAVRIQHEGAVVGRGILSANARRAIFLAAGGESRGVEGVHLGPGFGDKGYMQPAGGSLALSQPEAGLTRLMVARILSLAIAGPTLAAHQHGD